MGRAKNAAELLLLALGTYYFFGSRGPSGAPQWGFTDHAGNVKIELTYAGAGKFSEGVAAARQGELWGYIDRAGKWVIPPRFTRAEPFSDGVALTSESDDFLRGPYGFIDHAGNWTIAPRFNWAQSFSEGLAPVCEGNCGGSKATAFIGYIDHGGAYMVPPQFKFARPFSEGLARTDSGFIDPSGQVVFNLSDAVGEFRDGLAPTMHGYVDKTGAVKIPFSVRNGSYVGEFSDGLGLVSTEEGTYYDLRGGIVMKKQRAGDFSEGLAPAYDRGWFIGTPKWGYVDKKGNVVIDYQWNHALPFSEGLAAVCNNCLDWD